MSFPSSLAEGRYLLVTPLGEGGMATVFRGYDQRLQVWRAIKVLSPQYADRERLRARFEAEAQTMASLEHKHIVRVYDVGRDGAFAYIVMELIEGGALVDWLERHGAMPPRLAVEVTIQICEGLAAAHARGVIHRDIKPHNVLVTTEGVCRITDFGIARVGDTDQSMTRTGAVMGTWGYMAPEQRTDAKKVDERADVYSTAATLYTMLTDRLPMDLFASDRDASMMEGIDPSIAQVLVRASDYHRDARYADMAELAAALRQILPGLPADPTDTPPLAAEAPEPLPTPRPEDYLPATPAASKGSQGQTILPEGQVGPTAGGTIVAEAGEDTILREGEEPSDGGPTARRRATAPPAESRMGVGRILFGMVAALAAVVAVGGALVLGMSTFLAGEVRPDGAAASAVEGPDVTPVAVLDHEEPTEPEPTEAEPQAEGAADDDRPEVEPEPRPVAQPDRPRPRPTPTGTPEPEPQPVAQPEPVTVEPATEEPAGTESPDEPITIRLRAPTGSADPQPEVQPDPEPQAEPPPPAVSQQCVRAQAPPHGRMGGDVVIRATLCEADGSDVTIWYRPSGTHQWQSRLMPRVLGAHTVNIQLDERFQSGLDFYVVAGTASDGTSTTPRHLPVR